MNQTQQPVIKEVRSVMLEKTGRGPKRFTTRSGKKKKGCVQIDVIIQVGHS